MRNNTSSNELTKIVIQLDYLKTEDIAYLQENC